MSEIYRTIDNVTIAGFGQGGKIGAEMGEKRGMMQDDKAGEGVR